MQGAAWYGGGGSVDAAQFQATYGYSPQYAHALAQGPFGMPVLMLVFVFVFMVALRRNNNNSTCKCNSNSNGSTDKSRQLKRAAVAWVVGWQGGGERVGGSAVRNQERCLRRLACCVGCTCSTRRA